VVEAREDPDPQVWQRVGGTLVFSSEWADAHPDVAVSARADPSTPAAIRQLHNQISPAHDAWDLLPYVSAATLVIHGSDDGLVSVGNANLLADRIPSAKLHVVQGGRHGFFLEYQEESSRVVLDFLRRHPLTDDRAPSNH
jgi:pimeloyl-ACP methyl ester carboxylesterase